MFREVVLLEEDVVEEERLEELLEGGMMEIFCEVLLEDGGVREVF